MKKWRASTNNLKLNKTERDIQYFIVRVYTIQTFWAMWKFSIAKEIFNFRLCLQI